MDDKCLTLATIMRHRNLINAIGDKDQPNALISLCFKLSFDLGSKILFKTQSLHLSPVSIIKFTHSTDFRVGNTHLRILPCSNPTTYV